MNLLTKTFAYFQHFSDQKNTFDVDENRTGDVFKAFESL